MEAVKKLLLSSIFFLFIFGCQIETPPPSIGGGSGNVTSVASNSSYIIASHILTVYYVGFNETLLNATIISLAGTGGGNSSWNESYANTLYVPYTGALNNVSLGTKNISASYYYGNGTQLDGLCLSNGTRCNATSHSNLTNLNNDDHIQYLLTNGSRNMTGNLTFNYGQGYVRMMNFTAWGNSSTMGNFTVYENSTTVILKPLNSKGICIGNC